ncbi:MAG: lactate racemase domain-containing protein [Bacteroidales bacterium]|nr:lactate racemase domain-containing protein [Bacteroidales bacterium]
MTYSIKYGNQLEELDAPANTEHISVKPPERKIDRQSFLDELAAVIKPGIRSAGIIVSDKTRLCSYDSYLPWVTGLLRKTLPPEAIKIYIAYGTHPRQTDEESLNTYGSVYNEYEFIHHDCDDSKMMTLLGQTSRGTGVRIRKDILEHDQLILFGAISHHYFAGYGGGRKLLFPGLAGREAIYDNHKLFIDFDNMSLSEGCHSGRLEGNPVAEDLLEIDKMMPEKIIISGIPGAQEDISRLLISSSYDGFRKACKLYDKYYRTSGDIKYDNIIAGTGGFPKDINFIQSHKSLHNAASFVKDGGNLFILAECRDGIGNDSFLKIFQGSRQDIFNKLKNNYSGNGGTALSLISKTERINVHMLSTLDGEVCNLLNIRKLNTEGLRNRIAKLKGSTAVISNAAVLYS